MRRATREQTRLTPLFLRVPSRGLSVGHHPVPYPLCSRQRSRRPANPSRDQGHFVAPFPVPAPRSSGGSGPGRAGGDHARGRPARPASAACPRATRRGPPAPARRGRRGTSPPPSGRPRARRGVRAIRALSSLIPAKELAHQAVGRHLVAGSEPRSARACSTSRSCSSLCGSSIRSTLVRGRSRASPAISACPIRRTGKVLLRSLDRVGRVGIEPTTGGL
jgi:hypothetical protein